jgi:hypothetical protein
MLNFCDPSAHQGMAARIANLVCAFVRDQGRSSMPRAFLSSLLIACTAVAAQAADPNPSIKLVTNDHGELHFELLAEVPIHRPAPEHLKLVEVGKDEDLLDFGERWNDLERIEVEKIYRFNLTWRGAKLRIKHPTKEEKQRKAIAEQFDEGRLPLVDLRGRAELAADKQYELTWACWPIGAAKAIEVTYKLDWEKVAKIPASDGAVSLELKADQTTVKRGEEIRWTAELVNRGQRAVTLVQPGDGSTYGWRTPYIGWKTDGEGPRGIGLRCGNINQLTKEEIIVLQPGERVALSEWIDSPSLAESGKHTVTLHYINHPRIRWKGLPLGEQDPAAMRQVRQSDRVIAESNAVEITLVD